MLTTRRSAAVTFVAFVAAVPVATFWLIGDLSEPDDSYYLDHFWKASISDSSIKVAGLGALLVLFVATACLVRTARPLRQHLPEVRAALTLVLAGEILAVGVRVLTAGTSGANIAAALFLMFGLPVSAVLVVAATIALVHHRQAPSRTGS